jgi:DnaK suppressor protein
MSQQLDLDAFRRQLESRRDEIRDEVARLDEQAMNVNQTEGYGVKNHPAEDATELYDRERSLAVSAVIHSELEQIEHALERIAAGSYGTCEVCGKPIPVERLEARPTATLCIDDQRARDAQGE